MRESYFKQLYEWELYNEKVKWIKTMKSQQNRLKQAQNEKEERIRKKRAELENRPNPYLKEIDTCEHLIQYCNRLKVQFGLAQPTTEEVAKETQKEMISEHSRKEIEQKIKEGKVMLAVKEDDTVQIGGGKGKKGKKPKQPQAKQETAFNIDFAAINKFSLVQVSPPIKPEDLDHKIEELQGSLKRFIDNGQAELDKDKKNMEEHLKNIERLVEEEIQAEIKAAAQEEQEDSEEEKKPEPEKKTYA